MSFVLPGNQRQLRFTGEQKASGDEQSGLALGKPRVRKPTTPAPAPRTEVMRHPSLPPPPDSGARGSMTAPSPGQRQTDPRRISTPVPGFNPYSPHARSERAGTGPIRHDESIAGFDEQATMAFDREAHDIMPGGMGRGADLRDTRPPPGVGRGAPIPHFRPAPNTMQQQAVIVPSGAAATATGSTQLRTVSKGAPLGLWIFAAVLAGILSYHVTPAVMSHFDAPPPPPAHAGG